MSRKIAEFLALGGGHTRSIALDRDLHDESTVANYLVTPAALGALRQIGVGITTRQAQRAWKIVGPYGSGKSALGVMLAQLLSGKHAHPAAARAVQKAGSEVGSLFRTAKRFSLAIVGSRLSIGVALGNAIGAALKRLGKSKELSAFSKRLDLVAMTYKGLPLNSIAGELAADFAATVVQLDYDGVVLLIDEVGKFIEQAALHPEEGDLIALQQIAEQACRADDPKLVVVALLHQHFASYAAGVGRSLQDEWHKVASRFDEVAFDEPVERYAHFAVHALGVKAGLASHLGIGAAARDLYAKADKLRVLRSRTDVDRQLFERADALYPLHPFTIAALAVVSKRYGQSERSFHAFLRGNEPLGLREFAEREASPRTWYRLSDLFDFLAKGPGLRFRDLSAERRWVFALATIERQTFEPAVQRTLKCIAVMELVAGGLTVPITAELLAFALGDTSADAVTTLCGRLVEQGILIRRRVTAEYAFAVSDAVNIEAVYERASKVGEEGLAIEGLSQALSQRLIVANRHYATAGTIRTMGVTVGSLGAWPKVPVSKSDDLQPDAWLKLVIVVKDSEEESEAKARFKTDKDALIVSGCLALAPASRAALAEYAIWLNVQREITSKRLDPWTNQYVAGRLHEARETVGDRVLSELLPAEGRSGLQYWHLGKAIKDSQNMNTSRLASWLFDKVYEKTPTIVNELINKDRPTSAIVLARQRMFDVILGADKSRPICAPQEFPPERLIHHTLLRQTGIWREEDGRWSLAEPASGAAIDLSGVWAAISAALQARTPPTFAALLDRLAAPPWGVRAGPAGVWLVLYVLIHRDRCAVFERGTLVLELTSEHLQRMYKNPQLFELRELEQGEGSRSLLRDYRTALAAVGCPVDGEVSFLELARSLYRWFERLPEFSQQTMRLSKEAVLLRSAIDKAQDPIKFLTATLPHLYGETGLKMPFGDWLRATLTELGLANRKLHEFVAGDLGQAFGIAGPLSRVRSQLQAECAVPAADIAEARLKSFIVRCTDLSLTDEKWLDSIGSLLVQRPLDAWEDDTIGRFSQALIELCGQYKRWMQLVTQRGKLPRAAERFVSVTLTLGGGQETSLFFAASEESTAVARSVLDVVQQLAKGDAGLAASALAEALIEMQGSKSNKTEGGEANVDRKAR
jgi:hypothetical protein